MAGWGAALAMPAVHTAWAADPIRIGVVTPLSGPQQLAGDFIRLGATIAADQLNASGGVQGRRIELDFRDDKVSPALTVQHARELIGAGTVLQLGVLSSASALAVAPVMAREGGIMFTCGAGSDKINHEAYSPNVFRPGDNPWMRMHAQARLAVDRYPGVTRWGGMIPDHEYGRSTWQCFVDGLLTYGGGKLEIVDPVLVPYGASDFKGNITAAMRQNTEGWFVSVYGGDAVTLFQQARPFGLFQRAKAIIDSSNEFQVSAALKSQFPTQWTGLFWYPEAHADNPLSRDPYAEFVHRTGKHYAGGWMSEAHSSLRAYAHAIELNGGSLDVPSLIGKLKGLTWDTVTGPRTLRAEDNQGIKDIELVLLKAADNELGADVAEFVRIPGADVIEPPTPGQPLSFRRV